MKAISQLKSISFSFFVFLQLLSTCAFATGLKVDESVLLFKVDAHQAKPANTKKPLEEKSGEMTLWSVPLHAWVFEKEENSLWRNKLTEQIANEIKWDTQTTETLNLQKQLQAKLKLFLVDSQSYKTLALTIGNQHFSFGHSGFNGHIQKTLNFTSNNTKPWEDVIINSQALAAKKKFRKSTIQLVPYHGLSIISDIDDTIKDSQVLNKKELLKNTFIRPAKPIKSMNNWYQAMIEHYSKRYHSRTTVHYVSASPWQLYPMLEQFLRQYNFPNGSLYLRNFRFKDQSFFDFMKSSENYKVNRISQLIARYPGRDFILIGDTGEHDPEIYARILRKFPRQIQKIYLRKVPDSNLSVQRFNETFKHIKPEMWLLIDEQKLPELYL